MYVVGWIHCTCSLRELEHTKEMAVRREVRRIKSQVVLFSQSHIKGFFRDLSWIFLVVYGTPETPLP